MTARLEVTRPRAGKGISRNSDRSEEYPFAHGLEVANAHSSGPGLAQFLTSVGTAMLGCVWFGVHDRWFFLQEPRHTRRRRFAVGVDQRVSVGGAEDDQRRALPAVDHARPHSIGPVRCLPPHRTR